MFTLEIHLRHQPENYLTWATEYHLVVSFCVIEGQVLLDPKGDLML